MSGFLIFLLCGFLFVGLGWVLTQAPVFQGLRNRVKDTQSFAASARFTYQFLAALTWIWQKIVKPVTAPIRWLFWKVWRWYRRVWDRVVYLESGHFSRPRAGILLTATFTALYVLPSVFMFVGQIGLFVVTVQHEQIALMGPSEEIYPDDNIHAVKASDEKNPDLITDQTTLYFRIEPNLFHHLWSLFTSGHIFYPDEVAAAVKTGTYLCDTVNYGFRWKTMMRRLDIYPDLLSVGKCTRLD